MSQPIGRLWKDAVEWEEYYSISDLGEVWSKRTNKLLKPGKTSNGYLSVCFCVNGSQITKLIHHLVAEAFIGPRLKGQVVRHLDDVKTNNHLSNLSYGTFHDNNIDAIRNGRNKKVLQETCKFGHRLVQHRRQRACRECVAEYVRKKRRGLL